MLPIDVGHEHKMNSPTKPAKTVRRRVLLFMAVEIECQVSREPDYEVVVLTAFRRGGR